MPKTQLPLLLFLFLFISFSGASQKSLSDEEQKAFIQNDILESHQSANSISSSSNVITESFSPPVQFADADDDGMDDDWETANGLNPDNAKDAWWDVDNDNILNLFEFQLETDPNDASSPAVVQISPADGVSMIKQTIDAAENDIRVIQLAQGLYDGSAVNILDENFRIMIQGGWNDDFTTQDPFQYPTNWSAVNTEALNIIVPLDNDAITKSTFILDGINFNAIDGFSLNGAASINMSSGYSAISIYDCTFNSSTFYGLSLFHKRLAASNDVFIINSILGNNSEGGAYTQATDDVFARWRLFNTTINNPESDEGGIDGLTSNGAQLKIELTNCINWGNTNYSINFGASANLEVETFNSNLDESAPTVNISSLGNTIDANPLFQNALGNDWSLAMGSPCIDTGIDIGLDFNGTAPDMGAIKTIISSVEEPGYFKDLKVYPNPSREFISIELDELMGQLVEVSIYDVLGNLLRTEKRMITGKLRMDTADLPNGLLIIDLKVDDDRYSVKVIKE